MSVLYLWFYNKTTFRKMAVCGGIFWVSGWAVSSSQEHLLVSGDGSGAGPLGVTAGVQPKASAANSSELIAYLRHQTRLSQCLINDGGTWPRGDGVPTGLAYGHAPVEERMDFT